MNARICTLEILVLLIVLFIGGCRKVGTWLAKDDIPAHADAMVILMGSIPDRVLLAVDMYKEGIANKVFVVEAQNDAYNELKVRGANMISGTKQVACAAIDLGIQECDIDILEGSAHSTQQEALTIRKYLADKPDIDTLILVTSSPHNLRASKIFKYVFRNSKTPVFVFCRTNPYTEFNAKKWWKSKDDIETVLLEYIKLGNFELFEKTDLMQAIN